MQQFSTEQIEQDRKSDTDATVKHPVNFQNKTLCVDARIYISLKFVNKTALCTEPGLQSTGQRFLEAVIVRDSVITVKSCWSCDSSCLVVLCRATL